MASLKNAVVAIQDRYDDQDLIFVQEATRPMVSTELISRLLQSCEEKESATICHLMNDYVQFRMCDGKSEYIDRNTVIAVQSPEAHRLSLLKEVFAKAQLQNHPLEESCCTMLLHHLGYEVNFVESHINNIKISREEDIAAFGALVKK